MPMPYIRIRADAEPWPTSYRRDRRMDSRWDRKRIARTLETNPRHRIKNETGRHAFASSRIASECSETLRDKRARMRRGETGNMQTVKLLGITDDVTKCQCCGRAGLKRTVVIQIGETCASRVYYGTTCAAKLLRFGQGARKSSLLIEREAKLASVKSRHAFAGVVYLASETVKPSIGQKEFNFSLQ